MQFNTSKCKILHVGRTNHRFQYVMDNQILESVTEERDLGVLVSDDLKVSANCLAAYNKANKILGMINRSITFRSKDILIPLYTSLVRPLVEYYTSAWSP
jgi:ribonuclease P/MRP protein subunit RPP40